MRPSGRSPGVSVTPQLNWSAMDAHSWSGARVPSAIQLTSPAKVEPVTRGSSAAAGETRASAARIAAARILGFMGFSFPPVRGLDAWCACDDAGFSRAVDVSNGLVVLQLPCSRRTVMIEPPFLPIEHLLPSVTHATVLAPRLLDWTHHPRGLT